MVTRLPAVLVLLMLAVPLAGNAADIKVMIDREPVTVNESFRLIFEADGSVDGDPDFSPLNEHFQILSTSQSSNISLINGELTTSKKWNLVVIAKKTGTISIPPISFGGDSSPAREIEVVEADTDSVQRGDSDIFLEVSASPMDPYVQSQVIYTLKLYRSVAIANASLDDPGVSNGDALIRRIDDDKSYDTKINGRTYRVLERNFAIYPQSSGRISIAPVNFMGQVARNSFSLMDPFGPQPRTIIRKSPTVNLDVRPVPDSFTGDYWLPAENLTIAEEWSTKPSALRTGEPVTRTLILTATGLAASQLPELSEWNIDNLNYYPDQPVLTDDRSGSGITGTRQEKAAIIPNKAGEYILPAISILWWDVTTDTLEYAEIPERRIQVQGAAVATDDSLVFDPAPSLPEPGSNVQSGPAQAGDGPGTDPAGEAVTGAESQFWKWASLVLALVWLLTMLIWIKTGRTAARRKDRGLANSNAAAKSVITACKGNDPVKTKENLLHWARLKWPDSPPLSLGEIAGRTGPELARELQILNGILYSHGNKKWSGENFLQAFRQESGGGNPVKELKKSGNLEPLYRI